MKIVSNIIEAHIFREKNNSIEFLLIKRAPGEWFEGIWQMVTGFIESDEPAYKTAIREIKEETGLSPKKFWVVPKVNSFYSQQKDEMNLIPIFTCLVEDDKKVVLSEEHSEYKWLCKEEAKKYLAWPGQKEAVDIIFDYFTKPNSPLVFNEIHLSEI